MRTYIWEYVFKQLFLTSQLQSCGWTRVHQAHPQLCCEKTHFPQSGNTLTSTAMYFTFGFWLNLKKKKGLSYSQRMNLTGAGVQAASQRLFTGTSIRLLPSSSDALQLFTEQYYSTDTVVKNGVFCCTVVYVDTVEMQWKCVLFAPIKA